VTGVPFSAVAVQETNQTLSDGNRISRKSQVNLFRDSQGRIRKEVTISGLGPLAASGPPKSFVVINDPVANANFVLHPETKVAEKTGHGFRGMKGPMSGAFEGKWRAHQQEEIASGNLKKEDLGTQMIAGVNAQGTRLTRTIPAGQIGNEKPILIVHETWVSNDLQMVVMSKRSNPWSGETTYKLTNIQRTEPAAALFAVPSDFTMKAGQPKARRPWLQTGAASTAARGQLNHDARSSLLKTARPFRSSPHRCGKGVAVLEALKQRGCEERMRQIPPGYFLGSLHSEEGYPTPGVFFVRSAQAIEKNSVEFCASAKKCERVRKNLKRKGIVDWVGERNSLEFQNGNCWYTPRPFS
jgi:hypothetical protein